MNDPYLKWLLGIILFQLTPHSAPEGDVGQIGCPETSVNIFVLLCLIPDRIKKNRNPNLSPLKMVIILLMA